MNHPLQSAGPALAIGLLAMASTGGTAAAFLSYHAPDPRMDTPSLIPEIKAPVLVVAGSEDDVVEGLVEAVQPIADGERVNLIVLDGADHFFRDLSAEEASCSFEGPLDASSLSTARKADVALRKDRALAGWVSNRHRAT